MKIKLDRTTLVQGPQGLCVKVNSRPDDQGIPVSAQQLDNWCVKQARANLIAPSSAVKSAEKAQ